MSRREGLYKFRGACKAHPMEIEKISDEARPTLSTPRLTLRPFALSDAKRVQLLAGTREVTSVTALIPYPYPDGLAESWISRHAEIATKGLGLQLAICLKDSKELIGCISLEGISTSNRKAEIAYWVGVEYWNKGYCSEAAQVLIQYAFQTLNLNKITSRHMAVNPASGKVMLKNGMKHEGTLRQEIYKDGAFHDLEVYGLLRGE
jgi:ribosomal-protein-alanine N-acetyltransferase